MFDLAWSEILVIAVVALVVIGPKELPLLLRSVGQWIRKARSLASEFQSGIDQMARDAEIADLRKQVEQAKDYATGKIMDPQSMIDPDGEIRRVLEASPSEPAPEPVFEALPAENPDANIPVEEPTVTVAETADPVVEEPAPVKKPRKPRKPKTETPPETEEPTRG